MCYIDDGIPSEVFVAHDRTARKDHQCTECGRTIARGERYRYTFTVTEGRAETDKTCAHCMVGRGWMLENCGVYYLGHLMSDMLEHAEEYPDLKDGLLEIVAGMRRKWRAFEGDGLMPAPTMPEGINARA